MESNHLSLESCLNEFFDANTSNHRKREIEEMLETFSRQGGSWRAALVILNQGDAASPYITMYSLSVVEKTIKYQWPLMLDQEKSEIKSTLFTFLLRHASASSSQRCQPFVRNKIVKVLSDVGKYSWPQDEPDFLNNILLITQSPDTSMIGLYFLKTISEEWISIGDEASTQRKLELRVNLTREIPNIFLILESILDAGLKERNSNPKLDSAHLSHISDIISLTLSTATHFCSWVTLDGTIPSRSHPQETRNSPFQESFIRILCQYSTINFDQEVHEPEMSQALLALGAVNEICYRKFVPKEFIKQMNFIVHFGLEILNKIVNRTSTVPLQNEYIEKVIEFMALIAGSHFNQYDQQSSKLWLSLLLPFTFRQTGSGFYYDCLDIWGRLLDYFTAQLSLVWEMQNRDDYVDIYKESVLALANGIVHSTIKFQLDSNREECFDVDDSNRELPGLMRNIEILVQIGELIPSSSLDSLVTTWTESCRFFGTLLTCLDPSTKTVMRINSAVEIEHFHFILQLVGRMASIFSGTVFKNEIILGKSFFQQLVGVYNFSQRFYFVNLDVIIKMNCEIVYSVSSWLHWLLRFHSEVILGESTLEDQHMFFEILGILTDVSFFALEHHEEIPRPILLANVTFFFTLVKLVRTQFIFQVGSTQALIHKIHLMKSSLDPEVYQVLNQCVGTLLLLPWQSVSQQEWETRTELYNAYAKGILDELMRTASDPDAVVTNIKILSDQLDLLMTENANSKKICWNAIKDAVPFIHKLSTTYLRHPVTCETILNFFCKIMEVLRQQAGIPFYEYTLNGLMSLFTSGHIMEDLLRDIDSFHIVFAKLLQMLQHVVKDPSTAFKKFVGGALTLCFDNIYPILSHRPISDLNTAFFSLIRDILHYRWNYFFPTLVLQSQNPSLPRDISSNFLTQQQDQLIVKRLDQILQSIGQSLMESDLDIFAYNLSTLSLWNEKHNFYYKVSRKVIVQFLTVLFQILIRKDHDLHKEEIMRVIHEMSTTDFIYFRTTFLHDYLQTAFPMVPAEQRNYLLLKFSTNSQDLSTATFRGADENRSSNSGIDFPSFTIMLSNFVDDLRYYNFLRECQNRSLMGRSTEVKTN